MVTNDTLLEPMMMQEYKYPDRKQQPNDEPVDWIFSGIGNTCAWLSVPRDSIAKHTKSKIFAIPDQSLAEIELIKPIGHVQVTERFIPRGFFRLGLGGIAAKSV